MESARHGSGRGEGRRRKHESGAEDPEDEVPVLGTTLPLVGGPYLLRLGLRSHVPFNVRAARVPLWGCALDRSDECEKPDPNLDLFLTYFLF